MGKESLLKFCLLLGDIALLYVALFIALWLRGANTSGQFGFFSYHFSTMYAGWIFLLFVLDVYDVYFFKKPLDFFFNVVIFSAAAFFTSITYFYFAPLDYSAPKTILVLNIAVFSVLFFAWRSVVARFLRSSDATAAYENIYKKVSLSSMSEDWFLENVALPNKVGEAVKRFTDVIFALAGLAACVILLPPIASFIKLDSPGPIFYSQKRVGKNGKVFTIHKFRSMTQNGAQDTQVWRETTKNAITKTGSVLRRLHLDELPQSWSMLKGDISFVGPRPEWIELAKLFEKEIPFYLHRYSVKPGIIGWAQINFPPSRSLGQVKEKFEYDLYYIKNRSLLLDFEIILKAAKLFFW